MQDYLNNKQKQKQQEQAAATTETVENNNNNNNEAVRIDYGDGGGGASTRHRQRARRPEFSEGSERRGKVVSSVSNKKASIDTEDGRQSSDNPFGPIVPINSSDYQDAFRCQFYNKTLCTLSNGREGCGESAIVCSSHGTNVNPSDSPALCYALWSNTSEGIAVTYKGCWIGQASGCASNARDVCLERGAPKTHLSLLFCCCTGSLCNSEVQHIPSADSNHSPEAGRSEIDPPNGKHFLCLCYMFY